MARELDDAILSMRTNELDIGTWLIKTEGDAAAVLAMDATLLAHQNHWLVRETIGLLRRTFSRLDVSSRSLFALIEPGSCFAGTCWSWPWPATAATSWRCPTTRRRAEDHGGEANFGLYPMATGQSRLERRFYDEQPALDAVRARLGQPLDADAAHSRWAW
jgi:benzoyl-CoA-dihydrodiol lyase